MKSDIIFLGIIRINYELEEKMSLSEIAMWERSSFFPSLNEWAFFEEETNAERLSSGKALR